MILDTNAFSAIADGDPAIKPIVQRAPVLALPVVVIGAYRFGIAQSARRSANQRWLTESLPKYLILDVTEETSAHYAGLRLELKSIGKPIPANDLWIAALCRQHSMPLLSRDRHFDVVPGLRRVGW